MKLLRLVAFVTGTLVMGLGCTGSTGLPPSTGTPAGMGPLKPEGGAAPASWEKRWEDAVSVAKREGEILIYLNAPSAARSAISGAFFKKFGVNVDIVVGSGGAIEARLISEYRAGIHQVDAFLPGATSSLAAKAQGILAPIEPMLMLPEVTAPGVWIDGALPFFDRDRTIVAYLSVTNPNVIYNSDLVKKGDITSYLDLLKPQWKGKLVMFDPTVSGAGQAGSAYLSQEWGGNDKAYEYIVSLVRQQETIITRDQRQQMEWVARGKYPVAIWPQAPATNEFLKAGAPLAAAALKETGRITPSNGGLAMPVKPPHPGGAMVFLNWFMSREGQTLAVNTMGVPSSRIDVPAEGIHPMFIPLPGQRYYIQNEETTLARGPFIEGLKRVLADLNK